MIESLYLRNFQCHEKLAVEFSSGVTTFVGETGAGKSAILRALKWVLMNQPTGDDFIGDWRKAPYALAKIKLDGRTILRKRGSGENYYRLDGRILKAFGTKVPSKIADVCNVGPINFQNQIEPPLWFTESAPEVSRRLNDIINLSSIDAALEVAAKRVRDCKGAVSFSETRLAEYRSERASTLWAVDFDTDVQSLEVIYERIAKIDARASRIASAALGVSEAALTHQNAAALILDAAKPMSVIFTYRAVAQRVESLGARLDQIERSRALATMPAPNIARLDKLRRLALDAGERHRKIHTISFGSGNLQWEVDDASRQIKQIEKKLASDKSQRCPVCGSRISRPS